VLNDKREEWRKEAKTYESGAFDLSSSRLIVGEIQG
jgi:hypothetical protein